LLDRRASGLAGKVVMDFSPLPKIDRVVVMGGGSAGLIAALTLKMRLPQLEVGVVHSTEIGVIGVGEGTTVAFPRHFFEYLKMNPAGFYAAAEPTWKLGIHFLWGPRPQGFFYTFANEYRNRWPDLPRNAGFYCDEQTPWLGMVSASMAADIAFPRKPDGSVHFHKLHAFHIENSHLVAWLDGECRRAGVTFTDGIVERAEPGPHGITALQLGDGRRIAGDLFIDASGFRSELLGRTLGEEFISYDASLFCDRAVIAGWPRTTEVIKPYTIAETMDAGWCWQIEHENWINRGYVYASRFISDEAALEELRRKNPKIANTPRLVKFRSGRYRRHWVGNVVAIGNAAGFVEPLEATALQVVCIESSTLADSLLDCLREPNQPLVDLYNLYNTRQWDDLRDFLAVHYRFNTRLDTPFWQACRAETDVAGAAPILRFYEANGPSAVADPVMFDPNNSFGLDGYLAMLVGQAVPHAKPYTAPAAETKIWHERLRNYGQHAAAGFSVAECLGMIRNGKIKFG
jgi:tryptophan 7-halogenase